MGEVELDTTCQEESDYRAPPGPEELTSVVSWVQESLSLGVEAAPSNSEEALTLGLTAASPFNLTPKSACPQDQWQRVTLE